MFTALDVLARLRLEGAVPDGEPEEKILARIDDMAEKVMNYLNTDGLPDGVFRTFCRLSAASLQSDYSAAAAGSGEVQSISEGDTSITFRSGSEAGKIDAASFITQFQGDLRRYRSVFFREAVDKWVFQQMR